MTFIAIGILCQIHSQTQKLLNSPVATLDGSSAAFFKARTIEYITARGQSFAFMYSIEAPKGRHLTVAVQLKFSVRKIAICAAPSPM
jgi:hypothetical protein